MNIVTIVLKSGAYSITRDTTASIWIFLTTTSYTGNKNVLKRHLIVPFWENHMQCDLYKLKGTFQRWKAIRKVWSTKYSKNHHATILFAHAMKCSHNSMGSKIGAMSKHTRVCYKWTACNECSFTVRQKLFDHFSNPYAGNNQQAGFIG